MNSFSRRLRQHLESIGWGAYDICKHFKDLPKEERLSEQYIYALCRGDKEPKDSMVLERLSSVPGLELSLTTLQAWYIEPHYPPESIREANLLVSTPAPP